MGIAHAWGATHAARFFLEFQGNFHGNLMVNQRIYFQKFRREKKNFASKAKGPQRRRDEGFLDEPVRGLLVFHTAFTRPQPTYLKPWLGSRGGHLPIYLSPWFETVKYKSNSLAGKYI